MFNDRRFDLDDYFGNRLTACQNEDGWYIICTWDDSGSASVCLDLDQLKELIEGLMSVLPDQEESH